MPNKKKIGKKMKGGNPRDNLNIDGPASPVATDAASRKKWGKGRARPANIGTPTIDNYNKWASEGLSRNQIRDREVKRRTAVRKNKAVGMTQREAEKAAAMEYGGDAAPIGKSKQGGSSYNKYTDNLYISGITAIGIVGVVLMMVSRSLIRFKYSEALSYGLLEASVTFSLLLILFKGIRNFKAQENTIIGVIRDVLNLTKYMLSRSTPGLLIMAQLAVLTWLMFTHADFLYETENLPRMFQIFNSIAIAMIIGQCWAWKDKVYEIMTGIKKYQSPLVVPGFILAAILCGISISQMWVILEYLKVDC